MRLPFIEKLKKTLYKTVTRYKWLAKWIFAIIIAGTALLFYESDIFKRLEFLTLDYRFLLRQPKPMAHDIVFIDMAEDSVKAIGRWPWPRSWHATITKALSDHRAKAIAFDVIFTEHQGGIDDAAFAEAMKEAGTVYLPFMFNLKSQDIKEIYKGKDIASISWPIEPLKENTRGTGFINAAVDEDGILRRIPLAVNYKNTQFYQLGFKIACDSLGLRDKDIIFYPDKHSIILKKPDGDIKIPLDENNELILNWRNKWGKAFKHFSYIEVIKSYALLGEGKKTPINLDNLKDKICIIGLTASGLIDIKSTPIDNSYPAVGVHATVIESILNNNFIHTTTRFVNMIIIFLVSIGVTLWLSGLRPLNGLYLAITCLVVYALFSAAIFVFYNIATVTFYPLFAIVISYGLTATYTQALQAIERAQLFTEATLDGLTHLYNVKHFNLLLEAEFKNVSLYRNRRLSIIMADLDNFKNLNDTYGHQAGDTILREIANIMKSKCRQLDVVARYGGEEFIIMLVGAGKGWTLGIAEKIRTAVETQQFTFKGESYSTSLSIGVVEYSNEKTKEELIEKADKALYKSKRDGKNRVSVYDSPV
ncbi:MAG: CHASE2 domain-containing protein [Candidatus Omnitrophica bacterium]|nr:CHASE2 domain-containing protein [Candidatus Omnitrophota bacterium]